MENNFDVIIIGGGPGGYVCAIRAAQLGLKTACIESRGSLGGTCLNIGCIPSKSLLNLSENFHKAKKDFNQQGIEISDLKLNIDKMMSNKDKSIQILTKGVEFLFKKNKVTYLKGKGVLFSKNDVVVYNNNKKENYKSKNIVILDSYFDTEIVSKNVLCLDIPGQGTYIETARINHRSVTILDKDTTRMLWLNRCRVS